MRAPGWRSHDTRRVRERGTFRDAEERQEAAMADTQKLREQRANIWQQMQTLINGAESENRDFTGEERGTYDRLEADLDSIGARIDRSEKADALDAQFSHVDRSRVVPPTGDSSGDARAEQYARVFDAWLHGEEMTHDDRKALRDLGWTDIKNAAGVGTGAAGGYTVPPEFRQKFVEALKWYGPMLREAEVIETESGANLQWPTNDDTGNVGAILAENTQVTEQDVVIGTASVDAYMYTSKLVRVSYQLIQDSAFNFPDWLQRKLGERVGRILNQHFTTGTGTAQPDGIVTSATVGVTGTGSFATTKGIGYDDLADLVESLDPAYGGGEGLKFMGHQSVRKAIRKLKDSQGRPLWEPSLQAGAPDTLLGYPLVLNNDMATLATSSKSLLFGNIRTAYVARLVTGLTLLQLNERYADYLQKGFLGFQRADGTLQDGNAVKVFQTTATA